MIIRIEKQFKKDYKKLAKQRRIEKLDEVIEKLASGQKLDPGYLDHALKGNWHGYRECHIEPDWLLIYKISSNVLKLARTGSHSGLFR